MCPASPTSPRSGRRDGVSGVVGRSCPDLSCASIAIGGDQGGRTRGRQAGVEFLGACEINPAGPVQALIHDRSIVSSIEGELRLACFLSATCPQFGHEALHGPIEMNVREFYQQTLVQRGFSSDPAQEAAVEKLQGVYEQWVDYRARRSTPFKRFINRPEVPRGVYMWGGVGRGKSFLMDSFYVVIPLVRKTRIHFHEFMRGVHRELDDMKGVADPLDEVARRIAKKYRLICFDEFHVSDIADAMILFNLFSALFEKGV